MGAPAPVVVGEIGESAIGRCCPHSSRTASVVIGVSKKFLSYPGAVFRLPQGGAETSFCRSPERLLGCLPQIFPGKTVTAQTSRAANDLVAPNDLEAWWLPFTANRSFKQRPRMIARAKGMHYYTPEGREVIDGAAGLWCCNAGHNRDEITAAIQAQAAELDYSPRSEERRVGKECRSRWSPYH